MVKCDREQWENWNRDIVVERPDRRCYPVSRAELAEVVGEAVAAGKRLRACGSHWAFAGVAVSPDWFVETAGLRATLYDVVPGALTDEARDQLVRQDGDAPLYSYYHVEAGITIRDLNLRLDRQPLPREDRRWSSLPADELPAGWRGTGRRWALPSMGGASGQTLAGAISTGTHGGDHDLPPIADAVVAIHLFGPGGEQWWIERDRAITDPDRLAAVLPGVRHRASTEFFDAVLVSVGRMGIVYSLVLRVVEQYWLEQVITRSQWERESAALRPPFAAFDQSRPGRQTSTPTRSVETVVLPYAKGGGGHTCYQTARWQVDSRETRPGRKGADLWGMLCRHSTITPVVVALIALTLAAMAVSWLVPVIGAVLIAVEAVVLLGLLALLVFARMSFGALIARACNVANRLGRSGLVRRALEAAIGWGRPRGTAGDVSYELMDLSELGGECYRADSIEVFFDAETGGHADFVDQDLFPAFERSAKAGRTVAGYVSLRFTGRSSALLAMQRWDLTASVEVSLLQGIDGNAELLYALERAALARGGTVHWGQDNTTSAADVAASFPALARWRACLAELVGDGPDTFDNEFCAVRGMGPKVP